MLGTETEFAQFSKIISADNVLLNSPRREVWEQDFPLSPRRMGEEAKASISESIYNLCATIIGAGVLSLPAAMLIAGLALGTILMVLGILSAIWSLFMLIETAKKVDAWNYTDLCIKTNGKWLAYILEIFRIIYITGVITIYQLICRELLNGILHEFGVSNDILLSSWSLALHPIIVICLLYPICILKELSSMNKISLLSIITMGYTIFIVIIEMPFYYEQNSATHTTVLFILNLGTFDAVSFVVFAFACQASFFTIYSELRRPTEYRIKRTLLQGLLIIFLLYYFIAAMGYLSTFEETPTMVCMRTPLKYFGKIDYFMTLGKVGVYVTVAISVPVMYQPLRRAVLNIIWGPEEQVKNPRNLVMTAIILGSSTFICVMFPKLRSVISIAGGLCAVPISFIVPTIAFVTSCELPWKHPKVWGSIVATIAITICGYASVINTIINIVNGDAS